jgi:Tfp pilus assembly protein PilF
LEDGVLRFIGPSFLFLVVLLSSLTTFAQRQPGRTTTTPFPSSISREARLEIQLVNENSRPWRAQVLVEVVGNGTVNVRGYTDSDGRVTFNLRSGSTYRARVSGDHDSEEVSFEILQGEMFHHETIKIKSPPAQTNRAAAGGTISAAELNVPGKAKKEYQKGLDAFNDKKWDKAREHFEKAVKDYPQFDEAFNNLGVCAMQQNDVAGAKAAFLKAAELNPHNAAATRNLGRIYLTKDNDPKNAREMLQKALAADPRSGETMTLLSYADLQTGDLDGAIATAKRVHSNGPQDQFPFAHLVAGRALERKGDKNAAAIEYKSYLKEAENTPEAQTAKEGLARLGTK